MTVNSEWVVMEVGGNKMETWTEVYLSSKRYHKAARNFDDVFKKGTEFS